MNEIYETKVKIFLINRDIFEATVKLIILRRHCERSEAIQ